ncbi:MAG: hypothetical protein PHE11_07500 [Candidatus Omnitrophica bacterium]|nr:hypothetical protein [Candidatus Omnitrophota bacterium]
MPETLTCFSCGRAYEPKSFAERKSYFMTGMCLKCQFGAIKDDSDLLDRLSGFRESLVAFQSEGVISVNPWSVLLEEATFRKYFGDGPDLVRKDIGAGFIRESKIYQGTEFAALVEGNNA